MWINNDAIFMQVVSPAKETLHPYYIVNDFSRNKHRSAYGNSAALSAEKNAFFPFLF